MRLSGLSGGSKKIIREVIICAIIWKRNWIWNKKLGLRGRSITIGCKNIIQVRGSER